MCFSVSIPSLDIDLRLFCRTCSWIQSVLRSHRISNTLKHLDSPLQGETFLEDSSINILHSTIESCSLLLNHIVPSCLPTMLSEVLGESLPYLGKPTLGQLAILIPEEFHLLVKNFDEIDTRRTGPLELCFADIIIQLANHTEEAIYSSLGFHLILFYPGLATPVSWGLHAWCYGV